MGKGNSGQVLVVGERDEVKGVSVIGEQSRSGEGGGEDVLECSVGMSLTEEDLPELSDVMVFMSRFKREVYWKATHWNERMMAVGQLLTALKKVSERQRSAAMKGGDGGGEKGRAILDRNSEEYIQRAINHLNQVRMVNAPGAVAGVGTECPMVLVFQLKWENPIVGDLVGVTGLSEGQSV
ncbi:unnamed protein product [Discosporangium mesarthrocarpum]